MWERGWSSLLCIIFFNSKQPCHNQNRNTCKKLSPNEACTLDIGNQYCTDLHGIALKNNKLNVAMAYIRHWGLVLICILYKAWQRCIFDGIFGSVHNNNMSSQFFVHDRALQTFSCTRKFVHWQNVICSSLKYTIFYLTFWLICYFCDIRLSCVSLNDSSEGCI